MNLLYIIFHELHKEKEKKMQFLPLSNEAFNELIICFHKFCKYESAIKNCQNLMLGFPKSNFFLDIVAPSGSPPVRWKNW